MNNVKPKPPPKPQNEDDDWETDPDFVNNLNEKEARWGAKTIEGSGHQESFRLDKLRLDVLKGDEIIKEKKLAEMPRPSEGYGGKFGLQTDRVDKCAAGFDYTGKVQQHPSQRDYSQGFGGAYGIQTDRVDKSALGWDSRGQLEKHESQTDYKKGFGGQFGIQTDRKDKSAANWEDREQVAKHESQTDYKKGFGGQFGVQTDRKDKSAAGWEEREQLTKHASQTDYKQGFGGKFGIQSDRKDQSAAGWGEQEKLAQHESQTDYKKGFGGQFGVQTERKDKSAVGWEEREQLTKHSSQIDYKKGFGNEESGGAQPKSVNNLKSEQKMVMHPDKPKNQSKVDDGPKKGAASSLRSKFEQMALQGDQQNVERAKEERERRKREDEQLRTKQAEEESGRQKRLEKEWAEKGENQEEEGRGGEKKAVTRIKTRPSIGVRLPFATTPAASVSIPAEDDQTVPTQIEETIVEAPQPPVQVLPPVIGGQMGGPAARESQMVEENDPWKEQEEEEEKQQAQPVFPAQTATPPHQNAQEQNSEQKQPASLHHYELPPTDDGALDGSGVTDLNPPADPAPSTAAPLTAIALFEYERQDEDEIGFDVNDVITEIEQIDAGWWRGWCKGQFGLFPANYVQVVQPHQ